MMCLLKAGFSRLWKNRVFYILLGCMALLGIGVPWMQYSSNVEYEIHITPDSGYAVFGIAAAIAVSVFVSLFIGTEYSDGALRRKILVGRGRGAVYLANLTVCLAAGLFLCAAYLIPFLCAALPLLGPFAFEWDHVLLTMLYIFLMVAAFASLYVFLTMACQSKSHAAVGCILFCFLLLFAGMRLSSSLGEPETYGPSMEYIGGEFVAREAEPNPNYLSGTKRLVYQFLYEFLPGGQAVALASPGGERPFTMPLYSGILLVVSTCGGMLMFQKKDLN